jgi:hypothetical protein
MEFTFFQVSWIPFIFTVLGSFYELLFKDRRYSLVFFSASSLGIIVFSLTHVSLCSDYFSYIQIYSAAGNELHLSSFLTIDGAYKVLATTWKILVDGFQIRLSRLDYYHFFTALYQSFSILLLILLIFRISYRWRNTLFFLTFFGSLQLQHIILCGIRHGLSSSFLALSFFALLRWIQLGKSKSGASQLFASLCLFSLSVFSHWQAIIIGFIVFSYLLYKSKYLNVITKFFLLNKKPVIVIALLALFSVIYVFPNLFVSTIISPFSSIFSRDISYRIGLYSSLTSEGSYGTRAGLLTLFIDIILLYLSFQKLKYLNFYLKSNNNSTRSETLYSHRVFLDWMIYLSIINVLAKLLVIAGMSVLLRVSLTLHLMQIICLPALIDNLKFKMRIPLVFIISLPYSIFIFLVSGEKFLKLVTF